VILFCTRSDPDAVPACHGAWWGVRWGAPKCEKRERDVLVPTSTKRAYVVQEVRFVSVGWLVRFVCLIRVPVCPVCVPGPPGLFMEEPTSALLAQAVRVLLAGVTRLPRAPSFRRPPPSSRRLGRRAGRRSGSGWRQGRVRWGWPLLSRPRGAVGSGPVAVESAAASVVVLTCGMCVVGGFGWL